VVSRARADRFRGEFSPENLHPDPRRTMNLIGAFLLRCGRGAVRQFSGIRWPWFAAGLILAVHGVVEWAGGYGEVGWWFRNFGLSRGEFAQGKVWQPASYALLHGNWLHVAINALCLILIGSRVEHVAGGGRFLKILVLGAVGGGLAHLLLVPAGVLVGASGACVACLLLLTTLSPESRMWPLPVSGRYLGIGILASGLFLALINPALDFPLFGRFGRVLAGLGLGGWFEVGHACHFGGGLAGWAFGMWLLRPRVTLERLRRERMKREGGG
jgi:membrane associated rhomboid family serine protease